MLCTLRRSDECTCGCRAWCSTFPLLKCIQWQLRCMAEGKRPVVTHTCEKFPASQAPNTSDLTYTAALIFIKGDWCEHSRTLGLAPWNQNHNCCQYCECEHSEMFDEEHLFSHWLLRSHESYEEAVG
eukprot:6143185-Pyramimonas_sp.AAC.1